MIPMILTAISLGLFIAAIVAEWIDSIKFTEGFMDPIDLGSSLSTYDSPPTSYMEEEDAGADNPLDLPWIASWSAADRAARAGHNCAVKFTEAGPSNTTIITTSKSCEAGLPHTRAGDRIVIPDSIPEALRAEILQHEMIHIFQKRNPEKWTRFYKQSWDFELLQDPPSGIPDHLVKSRRGNPDTWQSPWCRWRGRFWSFSIYTNPLVPSLLDARTVWWDSWKDQLLDSAPSEWLEFFGTVSQPEHPHEIAAVLLVAQDRSHEAGRRLENWFALNSQQ